MPNSYTPRLLRIIAQLRTAHLHCTSAAQRAALKTAKEAFMSGEIKTMQEADEAMERFLNA